MREEQNADGATVLVARDANYSPELSFELTTDGLVQLFVDEEPTKEDSTCILLSLTRDEAYAVCSAVLELIDKDEEEAFPTEGGEPQPAEAQAA